MVAPNDQAVWHLFLMIFQRRELTSFVIPRSWKSWLLLLDSITWSAQMQWGMAMGFFDFPTVSPLVKSVCPSRRSRLEAFGGILSILFSLSLATASGPSLGRIQGEAMGMSYRCLLAGGIAEADKERLGEMIRLELARMESIFSLYRDDSELSRWNAKRSTEWLDVSDEILTLFLRAEDLWKKTSGSFDPTIRPLARLWGFGEIQTQWQPPSKDQIEQVRGLVGMDRIEARLSPPALRKEIGELELDLNALVEGFALQRIADLLIALNRKHFLIELGGEFTAAGTDGNGQPWTIALESPSGGIAGRVRLRNQSISSSGTYRNKKVFQGEEFPHLLDAKKGYPIKSPVELVSVLSASPLESDGWATVLQLVPRDQMIVLARDQKIACCWFDREKKSFDCSEAWLEQVDGFSPAVSRNPWIYGCFFGFLAMIISLASIRLLYLVQQ
jgi:thiamine biosynthesis lipoprotein